MSPATVTIDGPAACGKSTAGRGVAERLGYHHVNSGFLYRAVTWAALRGGWADADDFEERLEALELELAPREVEYAVCVEGEEPGDRLHAPEVTARVSEVSARRPVRRKVNRILRREAGRRSLVADGRDVGSTVFPEADLKVFLTAEAEERARRRLLDYGEEPSAGAVEREAERLRRRDRMDASRELSPLRKPAGAVEIDTTDLSPGEVVDKIVDEARRRGLQGT